MDEFLKVINGIDWNQLHKQKYELLQVVEDQEKLFGKSGELMGIVHLLDDLQDVASKLQIWTFPFERYDGNCPECDSKNYEFLEGDEEVVTYECHDCGKTFDIDTLAFCFGCGKEEYINLVERINGKTYCETCAPKQLKGTEGQDRESYSDDQDRDNYTPIELEDGGL